MGTRSMALGGLVVVLVAASLSGCGDEGDLSVVNDGPTDVTVTLGDEQATVTAGGGVDFLDYGCTPGDVTVEFPSGLSVVAPGPVCPEQEVVIGDDTVEVVPHR